MLSSQDVVSYHERGWLRIPGIFSAGETAELQGALEEVMSEWAVESPGWPGSWRRLYMDEDTERRSTLITMFEFHLFSSAWTRAVTNPRLVEAMVDLLGPDVELHQSTLHAKPPGAGMPFPLHQDHPFYPFYPHADDRFVAVLVHLDDTCHDNGEIRFHEGSHLRGPLRHITEASAPYLPVEEWHLAGTVAVPANAGDVVCFNINTVHGSYINRTDRVRRMVRLGYRVPSNRQLGGQNQGRAGMMVAGRRRREQGQEAHELVFGVPAPGLATRAAEAGATRAAQAGATRAAGEGTGKRMVRGPG